MAFVERSSSDFNVRGCHLGTLLQRKLVFSVSGVGSESPHFQRALGDAGVSVRGPRVDSGAPEFCHFKLWVIFPLNGLVRSLSPKMRYESVCTVNGYLPGQFPLDPKLCSRGALHLSEARAGSPGHDRETVAS